MHAIIGTGGILAIQGVAEVPTNGVPLIEIGKLVIQVIIGLATLWKMFKKPKEEIINQEKK